MRNACMLILILGAAILPGRTSRAGEKDEFLFSGADSQMKLKVNQAVCKGIEFLFLQQRPDGSFQDVDLTDHQDVQTQEIPYKLPDREAQPASQQIDQQVPGAPSLPQIEKGSVGAGND